MTRAADPVAAEIDLDLAFRDLCLAYDEALQRGLKLVPADERRRRVELHCHSCAGWLVLPVRPWRPSSTAGRIVGFLVRHEHADS